MKGITLCAECAYYSMKKHKCIRGATSEGEPTARFYADCPLDDVVKVVRCKDCKHLLKDNASGSHLCMQNRFARRNVKLDDYCSYGEKEDNT